MLKLYDVKAGYDGIQIVNGITMEVADNQIVAIVGANGVGKSTTLKAIMQQIPLMGGSIEFDGVIISEKTTSQITELGISLVPEGRQLFPGMTVDENLDVGSCIKKNRVKREENRERMFEIFPKLKERRKQLAGTLSGGEQQMVATARALMSNPKLLIMDEPSWGLAPILVAEMFDTIEQVRQSGTSILIVEQNVQKTLQIADWGYVFENGNISMKGVGTDLLQDENLKKAYLGI